MKKQINFINDYISMKEINNLCIDKKSIIEKYININNIIYDIDYNNIIKDKNRPQEIKNKIKKYQNNFNNKKYFKNEYSIQGNIGKDIKDFGESISFGFSFIFILFSSGLFGYYFGIYILNTSQEISLILSFFSIFLTITMELFIYQIKDIKKNKKMKNNKLIN